MPIYRAETLVAVREDNKYRSNYKIDPALDKPIREYVVFLEGLERSPQEGRLNLPEKFFGPMLKELEGGLFSCELFKQKSEFIEFFENVDRKAGGKGIVKALLAIDELEESEEVIAFCREMLESLPEEESRQFYINKLDHFSKIPSLKPFEFDEKDEDSKDFFSVIFSLFIRYLFVQVDSLVVDNEKGAEEYFSSSGTLIAFLEIVLNARSQIANQKSLDVLLENIGNGDDKSLFKAVKIDKSLLFADAVKKRILAAQLSGDEDFFSKLGKAISDNPLKTIGQHGKTYSVLKLFWYAGLYKLTNEELHAFLESCGLIPPAYPYAFAKFLQRYIKGCNMII